MESERRWTVFDLCGIVTCSNMWKQWRRKRLLKAPFPAAWSKILEARVPLYFRLPEADRKELQGLVQVFIAEKNFEGCGGLAITIEIKVCIAAQACLLLLHRSSDYYRTLRSILVYPSKYSIRTSRHLGGGVVEERREVRLGEAWPTGAVVLAWDAVYGGVTDPEVGSNVVLHEFAHLLDFEDGSSNGAPLLDKTDSKSPDTTRHSSWAEILTAEFKRLRDKVEKGEEIYLNVYGTINPAEFFAVVTEFFFECPQEMKSESPSIYIELKKFYHQDPAQWVPHSPKIPNARACLARAAAKGRKGDLVGAFRDYTMALEIKVDCVEAYVGLGRVKQAQGDLSGALSDYDKAITLTPNDAKCYVYRGVLKKEMLELNSALLDFTRAVVLEPDYSDAYCHCGVIKQVKGDFKGALADYWKAIELAPENGWAYFRRGLMQYNSHKFGDALEDFRKASELLNGLNWGHRYVWLTRARTGDRVAATEELQVALANIGNGTLDDWNITIARFLVGEREESDLHKATGNLNNKKDRILQCEVLFYAGTKRFIEGDIKTAIEFFEKCLVVGDIYFTSCQSAAAELQFLKSAN